MVLRVVVDLLFYSPKCLINSPVVFPVFFAEFMNKRNEYRETATDHSHHNRSIHRLTALVGMDCLL